MVFRLEEGVGTSSLASCWSSRACARSLCACLLSAPTGCRSRAGEQDAEAPVAPTPVLSLPCHQLPPLQTVLGHPTSLSCYPGVPCPPKRGTIKSLCQLELPGGKEIPFPSWGISIYKAAKLLRTAALQQTYFQIFSVAALYILWFSLMRYAGLSMATTEVAFFLKKQ